MPVALEVETELPAWREEGLFSHAQSNGSWFRFSIRLHSGKRTDSEQGKHLFRVLVR